MSKRTIISPNTRLCKDFPICAKQFLLYLIVPPFKLVRSVCLNYTDIREKSIAMKPATIMAILLLQKPARKSTATVSVSIDG